MSDSGREETIESELRRAASMDTIEGDRQLATLRRRLTGEEIPARVDRYRITGRIGAGAMGAVYRAHDPNLDRRVAIKILNDPGATGHGNERALREAEALARLSHPNVVNVFEVGVTGNRIYIVMELVDGPSVDRWLRERPRHWRAILDVFLGAARGLAAVHAAGLLHRDFKPANVLIGADGRARVADFGLARAAHSDSDSEPASLGSPAAGSQSTLTETGTVLGTPAYMSLEQANADPIDTRADQFSYAVALYEALYGRRPYGGDTLSERLDAQKRGALRHPPRRSAVPEAIYEALQTALSADREDRFKSMDELLRHLVAARAKRLRLWKIAAGVTISAVAVGLVVSGGASDCHGGSTAVAEVYNAEVAARLRRTFVGTGLASAEVEADRTNRTLDAYAKAWAQTYRSVCDQLSDGTLPEETADRARVCLGRRLVELEALVGGLAASDAAALPNAATAGASLMPPDWCANAELLGDERPLPPRNAQRSAAEEIERQLAEFNTHRALGRHEDAAAMGDALVASAEQLGYEPLIVRAMLARALGLTSLRRHEDSVEAAEATYLRARGSGLDKIAATAAAELAMGSSLLNRAEDAGDWMRTAEAIAARTQDPLLRHSIATTRAIVSTNTGRYGEATAAYREALASCPYEPGDRPAHHAESQRGLGLSLVNAGRSAESLPVLKNARATLEDAVGPDHPLLSRIELTLGAALSDLDRGDEAEIEIRRALQRAERTVGPQHPLVAEALEGLGTAQYAQRKHAEALRSYDEAIERLRSAYGDDDGRVALAGLNRSLCLVELGRGVQGRAALQHSLAQFDTIWGRESHPAALALKNLAWAATLADDHTAAIRYYAESVAVYRKIEGEHSREALAGELELAKVLFAAGQTAEARTRLPPALALARQTLGADHETTIGLAELEMVLSGPLPEKSSASP